MNNNNYHTQLDKKNILHTIALNDQLIQNSKNDNTNYLQNVQYQNDQQYPNQNNQQYQNDSHKIDTRQFYDNKAAKPESINLDNDGENNLKSGVNKNGEIELSEDLIKNEEVTAPQCKKVDGVVMCNLPKQQQINKIPLDDNKENNYKHLMYEFAILPFIIVIVFTILTYSKSSLMLEKYLPKMDSLRGVVIRGMLLAVLIVTAKLILKTITTLQKIEK